MTVEISKNMVRTVYIDRPDCAIVTVVCSQTLAVVGEPDVDDVILGAREEEIALPVELDLR